MCPCIESEPAGSPHSTMSFRGDGSAARGQTAAKTETCRAVVGLLFNKRFVVVASHRSAYMSSCLLISSKDMRVLAPPAFAVSCIVQ